MVISSLLAPAELGHGTKTSGWICFSNLYMSLMCYLLYDAVIARARLSRTEGSRQLVVVLLVVFSFSLCLLIGLVESAALPALSLDRLRYLLIQRDTYSHTPFITQWKYKLGGTIYYNYRNILVIYNFKMRKTKTNL